MTVRKKFILTNSVSLMLSKETKFYFKRIVDFLFVSLFVFWFLLAVLELIMPGFAIYYINLSMLFVIIFILFIILNLFKNKDAESSLPASR